MTIYIPSILRCPQCDARIVLNNLISEYVRRRVLWLDGKSEGTSCSTNVIKCPKCMHVFFKDDAEVIMPIDLKNRHLDPSTLDGDRPIELEWDDFIDLAEKVYFAKNRERYIRIRIWWLWNDLMAYKRRNIPAWSRKEWSPERKVWLIVASPYAEDQPRGGPSPPETEKPNADRNLQRLLVLFDMGDLSQRLMKVEALRELARFEEAVALLDGISARRVKDFKDVVRLQRELCAAHDQHVRSLEFRKSER